MNLLVIILFNEVQTAHHNVPCSMYFPGLHSKIAQHIRSPVPETLFEFRNCEEQCINLAGLLEDPTKKPQVIVCPGYFSYNAAFVDANNCQLLNNLFATSGYKFIPLIVNTNSNFIASNKLIRKKSGQICYHNMFDSQLYLYYVNMNEIFPILTTLDPYKPLLQSGNSEDSLKAQADYRISDLSRGLQEALQQDFEAILGKADSEVCYRERDGFKTTICCFKQGISLYFSMGCYVVFGDTFFQIMLLDYKHKIDTQEPDTPNPSLIAQESAFICDSSQFERMDYGNSGQMGSSRLGHMASYEVDQMTFYQPEETTCSHSSQMAPYEVDQMVHNNAPGKMTHNEANKNSGNEANKNSGNEANKNSGNETEQKPYCPSEKMTYSQAIQSQKCTGAIVKQKPGKFPMHFIDFQSNPNISSFWEKHGCQQKELDHTIKSHLNYEIPQNKNQVRKKGKEATELRESRSKFIPETSQSADEECITSLNVDAEILQGARKKIKKKAQAAETSISELSNLIPKDDSEQQESEKSSEGDGNIPINGRKTKTNTLPEGASKRQTPGRKKKNAKASINRQKGKFNTTTEDDENVEVAPQNVINLIDEQTGEPIKTPKDDSERRKSNEEDEEKNKKQIELPKDEELLKFYHSFANMTIKKQNTDRTFTEQEIEDDLKKTEAYLKSNPDEKMNEACAMLNKKIMDEWKHKFLRLKKEKSDGQDIFPPQNMWLRYLCLKANFICRKNKSWEYRKWMPENNMEQPSNESYATAKKDGRRKYLNFLIVDALYFSPKAFKWSGDLESLCKELKKENVNPEEILLLPYGKEIGCFWVICLRLNVDHSKGVVKLGDKIILGDYKGQTHYHENPLAINKPKQYSFVFQKDSDRFPIKNISYHEITDLTDAEAEELLLPLFEKTFGDLSFKTKSFQLQFYSKFRLFKYCFNLKECYFQFRMMRVYIT